LKILQVIQKPQFRGAEIFACQLSNHLVDLGHEVKIVSLFPGNASLPFKGEMIHLNRPLSKRFLDYRGWKQLSNVISEFAPDVIQANAGDTLKFTILSKIIFQWKHPVIFRNANKISDFITTRFKFYLNKLLVDRLAYVISVSELCKQDFTITFNFRQNKIACVPIGIEVSSTNNNLQSDVEAYYRKRPVFVHAGSFVKEKNHEELIEIFDELTRLFPDASLILAGEGPLRERIVQKVKLMQMEDNVHFVGARRDVLSLVKHADAFLLPSLIEGLPGVILEAFYVKTAVVAYNVGGISEVINNETGFLVEPGDRKRFIESARRAVEDRSNTDVLTTKAFEFVTTYYNNAKIANRFAEIYRIVKANY
jgi:glycosyltransferase involved in cell wall biosynthesis